MTFLETRARIDPAEHEDPDAAALVRSTAASVLAHLQGLCAPPGGESFIYHPVLPFQVEGPATGDGELVRGDLGCSYGTSMYDFHCQYPIVNEDGCGVGCRKDGIVVLLPDGVRQPLFEYCRERRIRVTCNRCGQDITYETESTCAAMGGRPRGPGEIPGPPGGPLPAPDDEADDCAPVLRDPPRVLAPGGEVTHVLLLLDRSSSMEHCRKEAVEGFNLQLARLRRTAGETGKDVLVTLIAFGGTLELVRFARPVAEIEDLALDEYRCGIGTRLLDAFGFAFDLAKRHLPDGEGASYVLVAVSDGEESSSIYCTWRGITDRIRDRRRSGRWSFAYVGPDERVERAAEMLRLSRGEVMGYRPDPQGTVTSMALVSDALARHVTRSPAERFRAGLFLGGDDDSLN
jgi:hypothetical protein